MIRFKFLVLVIMLVGTLQILCASIVKLEEAKILGIEFMVTQTSTNIQFRSISGYPKDAATPDLYTISFNPSGFVVIAGDERSVPILAYSGNTSISLEIPGVSMLLHQYSKQIESIRKHEGLPKNRLWELMRNGDYTSFVSRQSVAPLITTTWAQNHPYNIYCPEVDSLAQTDYMGHTPNGCVAVAMAQVMKKWNYPPRGIGSHEYYHPMFGLQSANFGETRYNWQNMPDFLPINASNEESADIATLIYHCGVSVNMNYGAGLSSAITYDARDALINYFGYSNNASYESASNYSDGEWINMLKNDLSMGRPIIYKGDQDQSIGHAFIVDGYQENDDNDTWFHINWGFGGNGNDYWCLSLLNPFNHNWVIDQAGIFNLEPGYQTPISVEPSLGDGTITNPYQISSIGNLFWMCEYASRWDKQYIQTSNIDATETRYWQSGWIPIGMDSNNPFSGTYNGNGHAIDGLYINRPSMFSQGLFGYLDNATITNLGLSNIDFTAYYDVGGISGTCYNSSINQCFVSGSIHATVDYGYAGGLNGFCYNSTIDNSYSRCSISGQNMIGGLIGLSMSSIVNNCYSAGTVLGTGESVGGLIGNNSGSSVTGSYWDIDASGQSNSAIGFGRSTANMTYPYASNTYVEWDFASIWKNDTDHCYNDGYPYISPSGGPYGVIRGLITNESGAPLSFANVRANAFTTHTDQNGEYTLLLPSGDYDVCISALGYESVELQGISVEVGTTRFLDRTLYAQSSFVLVDCTIQLQESENIRISWNTLPEAQSYRIYRSFSPEPIDSDNWVEMLVTSANSYEFQPEATHCFYHVKAELGANPPPDDFVLVPGGTFTMGDTRGEGFSDELPTHSVTLNSFYIGKYEVTQAEYAQYMQPSSSWNYGHGDDYPAYYVSWYAIIKYCNLRSLAEGLTPCYTISGSTNPANWGSVPTSNNSTWNAAICNWNANGYRLPTEAEWEYAARGATNTPDYLYSGSDDINTVAWYYGNSGYTGHPVGTKAPNGLGLYDMSGNLWEWCWDWYSSYSSSPSSNPTGPASGSGRVKRGGYWYYSAILCRVALRNSYNPYYSSDYIGFRLCRAVP